VTKNRYTPSVHITGFPITQFPLTWFPLTPILAYVCINGGSPR
jgi:hypothetical protein